MELTQRQLDVLNHVVKDGQAWADNVLHPDHILAKVAKHEAHYDECVAKGNYKCRVDRDEEQRIIDLPTPMEVWLRRMVKTDRMGMSRVNEDILDGMADKSGVAQITLDRLQEKKDLRATKPPQPE